MNQVDKDELTETDAYGQIDPDSVIPGMAIGTAGCGIHPKYTGVRPPRVRCRTCRAYYDARHR